MMEGMLKRERALTDQAQNLPLDELKERLKEEWSSLNPREYKLINRDTLRAKMDYHSCSHLLDGDKKAEDEHKSPSSADEFLSYMETFDWSAYENGLACFQSSKWLTTMLVCSLETDANDTKHIIDIMESNTFEGLMKDVGKGLTDPKIENDAIEYLTENIKIYYQNFNKTLIKQLANGQSRENALKDQIEEKEASLVKLKRTRTSAEEEVENLERKLTTKTRAVSKR